jgi:DNA polymerase
MEYFLPGKMIGEIHGQPASAVLKATNGKQITVRIVPLYHPAAALYNGGLKETLFNDFKIIEKYIN